MKATNHAQKRWQERIMPAENPNQAILEAFNKAEWIWNEFKDEKLTNYYLADNIIFAVVNDAIVTVFKTDYGMGDDINKIITKELAKELKRAKENYNKYDAEIAGELSRYKQQINLYDLQIEAMQARVKAMEARRNGIKALVEKIEEEARQLQAEVDAIAKRLVYSVDWRLEELTSKGKKTA